MKESVNPLIFPEGVSGIMGLAPIGKGKLKEASFLYELKKYRKIDHLIFAINMGKGLGGKHINFGRWDVNALAKPDKGLVTI